MKRHDRERLLVAPWPRVTEIKRSTFKTDAHNQILQACLDQLDLNGGRLFAKQLACEMCGSPDAYCPRKGLGPINWDYIHQLVTEHINGPAPKDRETMLDYNKRRVHFKAITSTGVKLLSNGVDTLDEVDPEELRCAHPMRSGGSFPTEGWYNTRLTELRALNEVYEKIESEDAQAKRQTRAGRLMGEIEAGSIDADLGRELVRSDWRPTPIRTIKDLLDW